MAYAANILPTEAAYYTLNNATIINGVLTISPNGSASYTVTETDLAALTDIFRVSVVAQPATSGYSPRSFIRIDVVASNGTNYNFMLIPAGASGSVSSYEIEMAAGEYTSFTFTITSLDQVSFQLWELCPEASEEIDTTIIDGVVQSLPKLLYDYNMSPLTVNQDEATIGLITFNLLENTDLQGHFAITCVASEACTLTLRFKDTGITELYSPMLYDLQPGRSSIGIPHAYLHRLAGNHSTYITAQVSNGTLSVGTRAILYTIDGGYLAERIADLGIIIDDVTLSQHAGDYYPDYIWAIGIDGGEAMVRRKAYTAKAHIAFDPMYSVGPAKRAAIEFNGHWRLRADLEETIYTLVTDENPYIFLIDTNDNLVVQVGSDITTRLTLDTGVSSLSVCRAYDSMIYLEQDQGLICLYIKAGALYYCQYCYSDGRYLWTGPFSVTIPDIAGTIQSAYVHRLNDYRVSFVVTTDEANYWLISDRTYVGQTVKPERVDVLYADAPALVAQLQADDSVIPDLRVVNTVVGSDKKTLIATFNYPIRLHSADFFMEQLVVETGYSWIKSAVTNGNVLTLTLDEALANGSIIISYPATAFLQYNVISPFWHAANAETMIFSGGYNNETVGLNYASVTASVSERGIETIRNSAEDTISLTYTSVSATVTPYPIATNRFTQYPETVGVQYSTITGLVTIIQTGVSPI